MKFLAVFSRIALGGLMLFSGLNKFFHFVEMEMPGGRAGNFMAILSESQFLSVVAVLEILGGAMLVTGFFVPLGLVLLGPIVVNILLFHGLIEANWAEPMAIAPAVLFLLSLLGYSRAFAPVFRPTLERAD